MFISVFLVWRRHRKRLFHKSLRWKLHMKFSIIHRLFIDKNFHPHLIQHEKLGKHFLSASEWSQLLSGKPWVLFQEALEALSKSLEQYQKVSSSGWTEAAGVSRRVSGDRGGRGGREHHRHFHNIYLCKAIIVYKTHARNNIKAIKTEHINLKWFEFVLLSIMMGNVNFL